AGFGGGHFLKFLQVVLGVFGVALALVGLGEAELRGSVKRKNSNSRVVGGDSCIVFLQLGIEVADEVKGVWLIGRKLRDMLEGFNRLFVLGSFFVDQAEVVPAERVAGKFFGGFEKSFFGFVRFLLGKKGDTEIEFGKGVAGLSLQSFFKLF